MLPLAHFIHHLWSKNVIRFLLGSAVLIFICMESIGGRNDLDIFLSASCDVFHGEDIYSKTYFDGYHYYYSVLFATLIHPLTWVAPWISKCIWMVISILLLFRIRSLCFYFLPLERFSAAMKTLFGFFLLLFCLRFIKGNLHLGQMTIIILAMSLEVLYRTFNKQYVIAAVLLALSINFKLLPLVFIPYLIYRAQWKVAIFSSVLIAFFYIIPACWIGVEYNRQLMTSWWDLIQPNNTRHLLDLEEASFHGLTTFVASFFSDHMDGATEVQTKRNILALSMEQLFIVITSVRLLVAVFFLWFLRTWPFKDFPSKEKTWWEVSYLLIAVPLIFPHQQHYAFILCMPALAWILFRMMSDYLAGRTHLAHFIAVVFVYLTFNLSLLLGTYNAWYNHYKILTFGVFVLIFLLASMKPQNRSMEEF